MAAIDKGIVDVIEEMKTFCSCDVVFGKRDTSATTKPIIELIPENDGQITANNNLGITLNLPLNVNIVVDAQDELRAYELLNICITGLNQINPSAGYKIGDYAENGVDTATLTQVYEASTFKLIFPYSINFLL